MRAILFGLLTSGAFGQGYTNLDSGLVNLDLDGTGKKDHTELFRRISQGNTVAPLPILYGLTNEKGQSMLEVLGDYGFMMGGGPRPEVPSGFAIQKKSTVFGLDFSMAGFSCAACHSGEFHYRGDRYRVDGMPGLVDIEGWTLELVKAVQRNKPGLNIEWLKTSKRVLDYSLKYRGEPVDTKSNLVGSWEFGDDEIASILEGVDELITAQAEINRAQEGFTKNRPGISFRALSQDPAKVGFQMAFVEVFNEAKEKGGYEEGLLKERMGEEMNRIKSDAMFAKFNPTYKRSLGFLEKLKEEFEALRKRYNDGKKLIKSLEDSHPAGFGRDDAWGLIDLIIANENVTRLESPISIPPLFSCADYELFHCDGNTNSMMDRNIAQAVALGAEVKGDVAELDLREVHRANVYANHIQGPEWPSFFKPIDFELAKRGEKIFNDKVYDDYQSWDINGNILQPKAGQKPEKVSCADCHQNPKAYKDQIFYDVGTSKQRLLHYPNRPGVLEKVVNRVEVIRRETKKDSGIPDSESDKWEKYPGAKIYWNEHPGYVARPLDGIWASPPYLHNGSVRTLYELLLPVDERVKRFQLGNREYDPVRVGFQKKKAAMSYRYDTLLPGNSREGHEFGKMLSEEERMALVEYLKTFSKGERGIK